MRRLAAVAPALLAAALPAPASARPKAKDLVRRFREARGEERLRLAPAMALSRDRGALEELLAAFDPRSASARESAALARALGRSGDSRAAGPLREALAYLDSLEAGLKEPLPAHLQLLRRQALDSLGRLGGEGAEEALRGALAGRDPIAAEAAARALGRLQAKAASGDLLRAAAKGGGLAQAAREALGELGEAAPAAELAAAAAAADPYEASAAAYALARLGRKDGRERLSALAGAEGKAGLLAAYYLARLDERAGLARLEALLRGPDAGLSALAAEALGRSGNPRAALPLAEAAARADASLRAACARALGELGGERSVRALQALRADPNPAARAAAASALVELGEPD